MNEQKNGPAEYNYRGISPAHSRDWLPSSPPTPKRFGPRETCKLEEPATKSVPRAPSGYQPNPQPPPAPNQKKTKTQKSRRSCLSTALKQHQPVSASVVPPAPDFVEAPQSAWSPSPAPFPRPWPPPNSRPLPPEKKSPVANSLPHRRCCGGVLTLFDSQPCSTGRVGQRCQGRLGLGGCGLVVGAVVVGAGVGGAGAGVCWRREAGVRKEKENHVPSLRIGLRLWWRSWGRRTRACL